MAAKYTGKGSTIVSLEQQWLYGTHPFLRLSRVPVFFSDKKELHHPKALAVDPLGTKRCEQAYAVDSDGKENHLWIHVVNHAPRTELRKNGRKDPRYFAIRPFSPYYGKKSGDLFLRDGECEVWTTHLVTDSKNGKVLLAEQHPSNVQVERRYFTPRVWHAMEGEPPLEILLAGEQARRPSMPRTIPLLSEDEEKEFLWATGLSVIEEALCLLNSVPSPVTGRALAQRRLSGVFREGRPDGRFKLSTSPGKKPWAACTATVRSLEHLTNQLQVYGAWNGSSPVPRSSVYKIVQGLEAERLERIYGRPVIA